MALTAEQEARLAELEARAWDQDKEARLRELEAKEGPSVAESFARGAGQGATLGFQDEWSAAVELLLGRMLSPEAYEGETYETLRDEHRADIDRSREVNPTATFLGDLVGSLPATIATGGAAGSSIKAAAAIGAGEGALRGLGEAEDITEKPLEALTGTLTGGAIGGASGAAGQWLANKLAGRVAARRAANVADDAATPPPAGAADEVVSESTESASSSSKAFKEFGETPGRTTTERTIEETIEEPAFIPPKVTERDQVLAKLGGKNEKVVAYGKERGGREALSKAPSLDPQQPGNLRGQWDDAVEKVDKKLAGYEKKAGELIEKSGVEVTNTDMANIIQKRIAELKSSGYADTKPGKAAINLLEEKLGSFVGTTEGGTPYIKAGKRDAKWLRQYLQGLREENKGFFKKIDAGDSYSTEQEALQGLTTEIDDILKTQIDGYADHMKPYAKDLRAFLAVKKSMGRQQVADFFTNKVKKVAQDLLLGQRAPDEKWAKIVKEFGDAAETDFLGSAMDRIALAELFPDAASVTAEGLTMPAVISGAARAVTNPGGFAMDVARESAGPATRYIRRKTFEKAFVEEAAKWAKEGAEAASTSAKSASTKAAPTIIDRVEAAKEAPWKVLQFARRAGAGMIEAVPTSPVAGAGSRSIQSEPSQSTQSEPGSPSAASPETRTESADPIAPRDAVSEYLKARRTPQEPANRETESPSSMPEEVAPESAETSPERYTRGRGLAKYRGVLDRARERGPESEAATKYILQQRDPDFKEATVQRR